MKIRAHKTRKVLYVFARFEEFKMAEFTGGAIFATKRISKGDERRQCFYLLVNTSGVAELYRQGEFLGHVMPAGEGSYTDPNFNFKMLEKQYPLLAT